MTDEIAQQICSLEQANPLREPVLRAAIAALQLAPGTRGLDIGSGIGLQSSLLVEAIGPGGHVTGLDISPDLLAYARERIKGSSFADRVSFKEGDMRRLPFDDDSFDWAWSADCVGYPAGDLLSVLNEIVRVVRPGGTVALLGWTSQHLLPGYALFEARLNATCSAYAPLLRGKAPETHFLRSPRWFPEAGMPEPVSRTCIGEVQAPLASGIRAALTALFEMLWGAAIGEASAVDQREFERLCR
jgi:demethylmenaquinone methyltransferase/2-methoxy-6-polyprenyl-1,4-benzoquinol methylase